MPACSVGPRGPPGVQLYLGHRDNPVYHVGMKRDPISIVSGNNVRERCYSHRCHSGTGHRDYSGVGFNGIIKFLQSPLCDQVVDLSASRGIFGQCGSVGSYLAIRQNR